MSTRFSSAVRLRSRPEFDLVQREGRRVATRHLILLGRPNGLDRDRLGIIASRRFGHAVARARAKRRLRDLFRRSEPDDALARGVTPMDLVAIPRRELNTAPFPVIVREFDSALEKLRSTGRTQ